MEKSKEKQSHTTYQNLIALRQSSDNMHLQSHSFPSHATSTLTHIRPTICSHSSNLNRHIQMSLGRSLYIGGIAQKHISTVCVKGDVACLLHYFALFTSRSLPPWSFEQYWNWLHLPHHQPRRPPVPAHAYPLSKSASLKLPKITVVVYRCHRWKNLPTNTSKLKKNHTQTNPKRKILQIH